MTTKLQQEMARVIEEAADEHDRGDPQTFAYWLTREIHQAQAILAMPEIKGLVGALRNSNVELKCALEREQSIIGKEMLEMRIASNNNALAPFTDSAKGDV